jgi:hypothetical protein
MRPLNCSLTLVHCRASSYRSINSIDYTAKRMVILPIAFSCPLSHSRLSTLPTTRKLPGPRLLALQALNHFRLPTLALPTLALPTLALPTLALPTLHLGLQYLALETTALNSSRSLHYTVLIPC